jgi:hypothetical protein
MQRELKIGTVSWINDTPNPMYSTLQALTLSPEWIPKTYLGLSGTANSMYLGYGVSWFLRTGMGSSLCMAKDQSFLPMHGTLTKGSLL